MFATRRPISTSSSASGIVSYCLRLVETTHFAVGFFLPLGYFDIIVFLCFNQALVLVGLEGGEVVYQGSFYKVDYTHAENALLDLIEQSKVFHALLRKAVEPKSNS